MDLYDHNKLEEKKKIKLLKSDFIEYDDDATVMVVLAPKAECFKDQKWFKEVASIPISNSVEQRDANGSVLVSDPPYMWDQDQSLEEKSQGMLTVENFLLS